MNLFSHKDKIQHDFASTYAVPTLKGLIIVIAAVFILLALYVDNPYILAGMLAYIALP